MNRKQIQRGDIFLADLDPVVGNEQGGYRLVLVLQDDPHEQYQPTVVVAPILNQVRHPKSNQICLSEEPENAPFSLMLALDQIRCIDKIRLGAYKGSLEKRQMQSVKKALLLMLGLQDDGMPVEIPLCFTCMKNFLDAGHRVIRSNPNQEVKERCTYCNTKRGYDYFIL